MTEKYVPPKIWTQDNKGGNKWASINRPISGPTHDKELPVGEHALQLYSLGTPNGQKVTILLEELLAAGVKEAEYDAFLINIGEGTQFSSGFVGVNPNSKIPALVDKSGDTDVYASVPMRPQIVAMGGVGGLVWGKETPMTPRRVSTVEIFTCYQYSSGKVLSVLGSSWVGLIVVVLWHGLF